MTGVGRNTNREFTGCDKDEYDRGCRKPSDLEDGFYKDTIKLEPEYVTGIWMMKEKSRKDV
ncbi:hypothetical protein Tco_0574635, partial [Tanacetum coccineum]